MPLNKNAIARYRRLDACFKDQNKQYYIEDLIRECSDAIRTSDDQKATVSRSQVFADIKHLMDEYPDAIAKKRGERGRVYYRYVDPGFSLDNRPLSVDEVKMIRDTIQMLGRFKGLPHFDVLEDAVLLKYADNIRIVSPDSYRQHFLTRIRKSFERNE